MYKYIAEVFSSNAHQQTPAMRLLPCYICLILCCSPVLLLIAQPYQLSGIVVNGVDNTPLAGASVFINNASTGTVTNKDGTFIITGITSENVELVISYVSFETMVVKITRENINKRFRIQMVPRENELPEVTIVPVDKDGWKNWGKLFTDFFIGTSDNAKHCIIKNPEVLRFRYNKKIRMLTVTSIDRIIIKNDALGLSIEYQLEEFNYDARLAKTTYLGYTSFSEMEGSKRKNRQWANKRLEAYNGSLMHFVRAVYNNQPEKEGFETRTLIRLSKHDSATLPLYQRILQGDQTGFDTSRYFSQVFKNSTFSEPVVHITGKYLLPCDSIRFADTVGNVFGLWFPNHLLINYKNELERPEYAAQNYPVVKQRQTQRSMLHLVNARAILLDQNGSYYEPLDMFTEGYMGWEKIAEMLPIDYIPGQ